MPRPKVQILVCLNERPEGARKPSCGPRNGLKIYHRFKDRVRELGLRDDVMVVRTGCLKHCSQGLAVAIWPYNLWYAKVELDDVERILQESVVGEGRSVEELQMPDIPWE